jgi:hypothetical protein
MLDDDGKEVRAGSRIRFAFGTPGIRVEADVIERDGELIALTPDHKPKECRLDKLRVYVGNFWLMPECKHVPMKAALDDSVHCIRCGKHLGEAN